MVLQPKVFHGTHLGNRVIQKVTGKKLRDAEETDSPLYDNQTICAFSLPLSDGWQNRSHLDQVFGTSTLYLCYRLAKFSKM